MGCKFDAQKAGRHGTECRGTGLAQVGWVRMDMTTVTTKDSFYSIGAVGRGDVKNQGYTDKVNFDGLLDTVKAMDHNDAEVWSKVETPFFFFLNCLPGEPRAGKG